LFLSPSLPGRGGWRDGRERVGRVRGFFSLASVAIALTNLSTLAIVEA